MLAETYSEPANICDDVAWLAAPPLLLQRAQELRSIAQLPGAVPHRLKDVGVERRQLLAVRYTDEAGAVLLQAAVQLSLGCRVQCCNHRE